MIGATTPALTALMCDGMGSFSDADYKRMLLAFDQIYYLLPDQLVEFRDEDGRASHLILPQNVEDETQAFVPTTYALDDTRRSLLFRAAQFDLESDGLRSVAAEIPRDELQYTWG